MKSRTACEFSIESLTEGHKYCYLWTPTFADVVPLDQARKRWAAINRALRNNPVPIRKGREIVGKAKAEFIRVFEFHPGSEWKPSHGLHPHMITVQKWDINWMRRRFQFHGWGRLNVKRISCARARYIAKYLTKEHRPECAKGLRLWGAVNFPGKSRVKDIRTNSIEANSLRTLIRMGYKYHQARCVVTALTWRWVASDDTNGYQQLLL